MISKFTFECWPYEHYATGVIISIYTQVSQEATITSEIGWDYKIDKDKNLNLETKIKLKEEKRGFFCVKTESESIYIIREVHENRQKKIPWF